MYESELLTKQGAAVVSLARLLLTLNEGDRLPNNKDLEKSYNIGTGTLQGALKFLSSEGAVSLVSKGHQGTYLTDIDYVKTYRFSNLADVTGTMPLPYSLLLEGLATGITQCMTDMEIPGKIIYSRGGITRQNDLLEGNVDFMICSKLTGEKIISENPEVELIVDFGPKTYVRECGILFRERGEKELRDGMRLGIDKDSYDHTMLSHTISKDKHIELVPLDYFAIEQLLLDGQIDACFWTINSLKFYPTENIVSVSELDSPVYADTMRAVAIGTKDNPKENFLKKIIKKDLILDIQEQVYNSQINPKY